VWLLLLTIGAAALIVIVTGGSFTELGRLSVIAGWLLAAGLGLQVLLEIVTFPRDQLDTIGYGLLMLSYAFILAFCLTNVTTRGFGVIAVGIALNTLVIGLNQGMPTIPIGNDAHGNRVRKPIERTVKHRPERSDDLLQFLDDRIVLPKPFDTVVSFGDLVISVGICELAYSASRRRRRRRGSAPGAQRSAVSSPRRSRTRSRAPSTRPS
jgi:uncharacterized protein DUF5317